jgi:hypothetical protein
VDRRAFIAGTFGLLAGPLAANTQPAGTLYRIGYLTAGVTSDVGPPSPKSRTFLRAGAG